MVRENTKQNNCEVESINAATRGGSARSSVETVEIQWSQGAELSCERQQSTLQK
jgi:hypothetical protein